MRMFRSAKISHGVHVLVWMVREMSGVDRSGRVGEYEQGVARDNAVRLRQGNLRLRLRFACPGIGMLLDVFCWREGLLDYLRVLPRAKGNMVGTNFGTCEGVPLIDTRSLPFHLQMLRSPPHPRGELQEEEVRSQQPAPHEEEAQVSDFALGTLHLGLCVEYKRD